MEKQKLLNAFENYSKNAKKSIIESQLNNNEFFMTWEITNLCNFSCDYCQNSAKKTQKKENPRTHQEIVNAFNNTKKKWFINITGGEPLIYPGFLELVSELSINHYISIDTNLSTDDVYKLPNIKNPKNLMGIFSGVHFADRDKYKSNLDDYIKKVRFLQDKEIMVFASCIAFPDAYEDAKNQIDYLIDNGIKFISPKLYIGEYKGKYYPYDYNKQYLKKMETLKTCFEFDFIEFDRKTKGKTCLSGKKYFYMDKDDDLSRCSTISTKLGNFFTDDFDTILITKKCTADLCILAFEGIFLTKRNKKCVIRNLF